MHPMKTTALTAVCAMFVIGPVQTQVNYRNFRSASGVNILGDAVQMGSFIRLVPSHRDTRGNVWTQRPLPVTAGFRATFSFRYWHHGGSTDGNGHPGNDGLVFYIQPLDNALKLNIDPPARSLMIHFDGYKNYDRDDVSSSRVEVRVDGHRLGQEDVEPLGIRYRDGKVQRVRIDYDGKCLSVTMNDKLVATYRDVDLSPVSPGFVGFHGLGGDAYADVDLMSFRFDCLEPGEASRSATMVK